MAYSKIFHGRWIITLTIAVDSELTEAVSIIRVSVALAVQSRLEVPNFIPSVHSMASNIQAKILINIDDFIFLCRLAAVFQNVIRHFSRDIVTK